jgi:hypothetical protein
MQAYRTGQEDQLGALGLVLNAAVLWTTRYLDAAVEELWALPAEEREHDVLGELVMEEVLQALRAAGVPDEQIPARYHRIAVLIAALIASEAGVSTVTPEEHEQGMELFRVAVLGADPERFPTLAHFARDVRPLGADRRAAFEEILAAQLAHIEAAIHPSQPTDSGVSANDRLTTGGRRVQ